MMKRLGHGVVWVMAVVFCLALPVQAEELVPVTLPAPQTEGGRPLMQVLKDRTTSRSFSEKELPAQVLSNLLWAGFGINRPEAGKRTAPSARNWQEIDMYVVMAAGVYRYNAVAHRLDPVLAQDIRAATGMQPFVATAPVNLVFVANLDRMSGSDDAVKRQYAAADTGFICQNVYLFCASEGLACVVRGSVDKTALTPLLSLGDSQVITLAQTVGYPSP